MLDFIIWSPVPEIFSNGFFGTDYSPRWYGLLFAMGFIIGQQILYYIYKTEGKPEKDVDTLTVFVVVATIIGARLGHVLFYEPAYFLSNPGKILAIWNGGLASHGAAIGILLAIYLYVNYDIKTKNFLYVIPYSLKVKKRKKEGQSYFYVLDRLVILVALGGAFIRFGNFVNSEILGLPTESNYGVVFSRPAEEYIERSNAAIEKVESFRYEPEEALEAGIAPLGLRVIFKSDNYDQSQVEQYIENEVKRILIDYNRPAEQVIMSYDDEVKYSLFKERGQYVAEIQTKGIIRHPAQLYESISSFLLFVALFLIWYRKKQNLPKGLIFGIFLVVLFSLRFIYEFLKENQESFEDRLPLNMGQILSIPLVLAGVAILFQVWKNVRSSKSSE